MKALGDYIHSKGLKFGIYSSPGIRTCGGYEGSYGHEIQDAQTFADWGADYLKYDWCGAQLIYGKTRINFQAGYQKMALALMETARPIVYSICQYGEQEVWTWGKAAGGNLWRTTGDIHHNWQSVSHIGFRQNGLESHAEPGHWNDPDMLQVGNGDLTEDENKTHFALWCMLAAPLMSGNDLRNMDKDIVALLTHGGLVAINQDPLGQQGKRILKQGEIEVWSKPLASGETAIAVFNLGEDTSGTSFTWSDLGMESGPGRIIDVWTGETVAIEEDVFSCSVPRHGVAVVTMK